MEYSRTFSTVPGNFRKKRKKFLTNPIQLSVGYIDLKLSKYSPNVYLNNRNYIIQRVGFLLSFLVLFYTIYYIVPKRRCAQFCSLISSPMTFLSFSASLKIIYTVKTCAGKYLKFLFIVVRDV